jgi:hypothetical protein
MTRREFMFTTSFAALASTPSGASLVIPVHQVLDARSKHTPQQLHRFLWSIWYEAARDFQRCGIHLQTTKGGGEVKRSPADRPIIIGLDPAAINVVLTDHLPMKWDHGRALRGLTTEYEGHHVCMIALKYAHGHQIPFLSVNTCVHELLHVLLHDIFETRPSGFAGFMRESRIDALATRLWLFHEGAAIRQSAQAYLHRFRSELARRS